MNSRAKKSEHKFPAPWRHHEPAQADFDEARRISEMDGQLEGDDRIHPYIFSEQERDSIVKLLPDDAIAVAIEEFLLQLGLAIGSYKHWEKYPPERANFKKSYRELKKIRNYSDKLSQAISNLPTQFRERLDIGVCMGMLRDPLFGQFPGKPRYWTADWSSSFAFELATLQSVTDEVEKHFKKKNKGGGDTDVEMTLLARATLVAYVSCFDEIPPKTKSHPFAKILDVVTGISERHGSGVFSVFHYVDKVISEVKSEPT